MKYLMMFYLFKLKLCEDKLMISANKVSVTFFKSLVGWLGEKVSLQTSSLATYFWRVRSILNYM